MSKIREINTEEFEKAVLRADSPVVVDFYAPWCGPCKMIAPELEKLAEEFDGRSHIVKVNVDESPELAQQYGVHGVPTLLFFRDGHSVDAVVGYLPASALRRKLERVTSETAKR